LYAIPASKRLLNSYLKKVRMNMKTSRDKHYQVDCLEKRIKLLAEQRDHHERESLRFGAEVTRLANMIDDIERPSEIRRVYALMVLQGKLPV